MHSTSLTMSNLLQVILELDQAIDYNILEVLMFPIVTFISVDSLEYGMTYS